MKKIIPILILIFFASSAKAQSQDNQQQLQTLVQKVDSLAHELSYLKLNYEINALNSDILTFKNMLNATALEVQMNLFNRNFDSRLGRAYNETYKSCESRRKSIDELVKSMKDTFSLMINTQSYTNKEISVLTSNYDLTEKILVSLDTTMNVLKIVIEAYMDEM